VNLPGGRRKTAPPDPSSLAPTRILLASEGREIARGAVEAAAELAKRSKAPVRVFSIARIWGTSLGLPMPGLLPQKREWDEQRDLVTKAVKALRKQGIDAEGHVVATRRPAKRILREAARYECDVIVMGADRQRPWLIADWMWSQEPYRVRRRARIPVVLVQDDDRK
jgi:nucleotide-binding universal stress UspA family protein